MKIHLSFVAARDRATGKIEILANAHSLAAGSPCAVVSHIAAALRSSSAEGIDIREKYSHALVVIDNQERESFEFPDPAQAKIDTLQKAIVEASSEVAKASVVLSQASDAAAKAQSAASQHKAAVAQLDDLQKQLETAKATINAAPLIPPANPPDDQRAKLERLSEEELLEVAEAYDLDVGPFYFEAAKDGQRTLDSSGLIEAIISTAEA